MNTTRMHIRYSRVWQGLLHCIGDALLTYLFLNTSLFLQLDPENPGTSRSAAPTELEVDLPFIQICGPKLSSVYYCKPVRQEPRPRESLQSQRRDEGFRSRPLHLNQRKLPRGHIFYNSTHRLSAGLPPAHPLNQLPGSPGTPDHVADLEVGRRLLKRILFSHSSIQVLAPFLGCALSTSKSKDAPPQRSSSHASAPAVESPGVEIAQDSEALSPLELHSLPKFGDRLQRLERLLKTAARNHRRCPYDVLMRQFCPVPRTEAKLRGMNNPTRDSQGSTDGNAVEGASILDLAPSFSSDSATPSHRSLDDSNPTPETDPNCVALLTQDPTPEFLRSGNSFPIPSSRTGATQGRHTVSPTGRQTWPVIPTTPLQPTVRRSSERVPPPATPQSTGSHVYREQPQRPVLLGSWASFVPGASRELSSPLSSNASGFVTSPSAAASSPGSQSKLQACLQPSGTSGDDLAEVWDPAPLTHDSSWNEFGLSSVPHSTELPATWDESPVGLSDAPDVFLKHGKLTQEQMEAAEARRTRMDELVQQFCPPTAVAHFLTQAVMRVFPPALWGSRHNFQIIVGLIDR